IRLPVIAFVALLFALYGYFFWQTQVWTNFNPSFVDQYRLSERKVAAGQDVPFADGAAATAPKTCQRSAIVDVAADLTDFN
ncbi:DUF2333 domain-containing protein, partial [Rhizobium ruizarguesonis]